MKTQRFKVSMPPDDRDLLRKLAKRARMSEAEIVRRMIRRTANELRITASPETMAEQPPAAPPPAAMVATTPTAAPG